MDLGNIKAVFLFEWRRALTMPRIAWWVVLTMFPVFIVTLIRLSPAPDPPYQVWAVFLFALSPMLICMLGTFLWTTPAISAELERKSWVYLAVRPNGGTAVLLGKYLAAVTWVLPAALIGMTLAVFISQSEQMLQLWWTMIRMVCLSCPAYAAVYLLIGALVPKRSMVIAVSYTLFFELIISFVPALINKLTVQYRLRALLIDWADLDIVDTQNANMVALIGNAPAWFHIVVLIGYTAALLAGAVVLLRRSEYSATEEADV